MSDVVYDIHPVFSRWTTGWYGGRLVHNDYWDSYFRRDPLGRGLVTAVEVIIGNDLVLRLSNGKLSVSDDAGHVIGYMPVLSEAPKINSTVQVLSPTSSARSYTVKLPNELVDAAKLVREGAILAGYGEISLNYDGGKYENRMVLMRGEMDSGVTFQPADGGMIEFSITDPKESSDVSIPPYVVSPYRFDQNAVGAGTMGRRFPIVLNKWPNVPCTFTHKDAALVTYGWQPDVATDRVLVDGEYYAANDITYGFEIIPDSDRRGTPCQFVRFKHPDKLEEDRTESVYTSVTNAPGTANPVGQAEYLCKNYSVLGAAGINHNAFARAAARSATLSSQVCINASGDGNVSTLSFIEGELFSNFPMLGMVWDRGGYGPVYIDRQQKPSVRLYADQYPVFDRVSAVTESPKTSVYNSFTIKYNFTPYLNAYSGVVERNPSNSSNCLISMQQCGSRPMDAMECVYVYDERTANTIADWFVDHLAMPSYEVQYACSNEVMAILMLGDNVALTDDEFGWSELTATVLGIEYLTDHCILKLAVWDRFYKDGGSSYKGPVGRVVTSWEYLRPESS